MSPYSLLARGEMKMAGALPLPLAVLLAGLFFAGSTQASVPLGTGNGSLLGGDLTDPEDKVVDTGNYGGDKPQDELKPPNATWLTMKSAPNNPPGSLPHQRHPYQSWQGAPACAIFFSWIVLTLSAADSKKEEKKNEGAKPEEKKTPDNLELDLHEQTILDLVNGERAKRNAPQLQPNPQLFAAARAYARFLADKDKLSHTLDGKSHSQRAGEAGYKCGVGENIVSWSRGPANIAFEHWMGSENHRKNLQDPKWQVTGIGIARNPKSHMIYYVQMFGDERPRK